LAYMRDDYYIWSDGVNVHIHDRSRGDDASVSHVSVPEDTFEELAAMVFLRLSEQEREKAIKRAYRNHGGNFGCEGVAKYLGKPSGYDMVSKMVEGKESS